MLAPLILLFFGYMVYRSAKIIVFLLAPSNVLEGNSKTKMLRNFSADCLLFFFAWFLAYLDSTLYTVNAIGGNQFSGILMVVIFASLIIVLLQSLLNLVRVDYFRMYIKLLFWTIGMFFLAFVLDNFLINASIVTFLLFLAIFLGVAYYTYKKINIDLTI